MPIKTCDKRNTHGPHLYKSHTQKQCSGRTECGSWIHAKHDYMAVEETQCLGVCNCDLLPYSHNTTQHPVNRPPEEPAKRRVI